MSRRPCCFVRRPRCRLGLHMPPRTKKLQWKRKPAKAAPPAPPAPPAPQGDLHLSVAINIEDRRLAIFVNPPSPQIVFSREGALDFAENIRKMAESLPK